MVRDMTEGHPLRRILAFSAPLLLGNLFQQFYSMADSIIVGQYIGVNAFAAVGSTGSINFLILGFVQGACMGFAIPVAQEFGAGDMRAMRRCVANAAYLSVLVAIVVTALTALFTRDILRWMQTPEDIFEDAYSYIFIVFAGTGATVLYNLLASVLRALGDSRTPLIYLIIASIINIALDVVLIAVIPLGVAGAAYATVASQLVSGLLCLFHIKNKFLILHIEKQERRFDKSLCLRLLHAGVPMGLQFSITAIGSIILQSAVNALGSSVVASISAANRVQNILTCPLETMGATMATYCSQNYGANRIERVRQGIRQATIVTAIYSAAGLAIAYFCGRTIAQMFISAEETALLDSIRQFLTINGMFYFPLAIILVYRNSLQGLGFSNSAMLAGVFELVARSAVAWALVGTFGFIAVCFANPAAWIAADCLLLPMYAKKIRVLSRWQAARERLEAMQTEYEVSGRWARRPGASGWTAISPRALAAFPLARCKNSFAWGK